MADHWFDESPTAEPYFRAAGRLFLADARSQLLATSGGRVAVNSPATVALFAGLDHRLNLPGELIVVDAATQVPILTSEQQFERQYRLVPSTKDDWLPAGNPVLWLQSSSGLAALEPLERQRLTRPVSLVSSQFGGEGLGAKANGPAAASLPRGEKGVNEPVKCKLTCPPLEQAEEKEPGRPSGQRESLTVHGRYRGQIIRRETVFDVHPVPEITVRQHPLPEKASVAVRTGKEIAARHGVARGAVAFVLDCSGSMREAEGTDPAESPYAQSVQALRQCLQKVPRHHRQRLDLWPGR